MKKLMTLLAVFAMCGVAMADAPYSLKTGTETTTQTKHVAGEWVRSRYLTDEQRQYAGEEINYNGHRYTWVAEHDTTVTTTTIVPKTYTYKNGEGTTALTYTVTASTDYGKVRNYDRQFAQGYFTVTEDVPANKVVAVQFLGAEVEKGTNGGWNSGYDPNYKATDYGIYLYDAKNGEKIGDYLSVKDFNNYFGETAGIKAGTSFGVYFVDKDGNYIASTGDGMFAHTDTEWYKGEDGWYHQRTVTTYENAENGILGNFDDDSHKLKVYDPVTGEQTTKITDKHFLCLSAGEYGSDDFRQSHWEFMLQTTIDNPYFPVNPNDFNNDVHVDDPVVDGITGQPLPGTLATLLIGGLCAGSLRKRNKK